MGAYTTRGIVTVVVGDASTSVVVLYPLGKTVSERISSRTVIRLWAPVISTSIISEYHDALVNDGPYAFSAFDMPLAVRILNTEPGSPGIPDKLPFISEL